MKLLKQHLTTKVASSFLLLSLVAVGVVGGFAYFRARAALKQAAFNRLNVTATLKEEEISRWFEDQQRDFFLITQFPDIQAKLKTLLSPTTSDANRQGSYRILSEYLQRVVQLKPNLEEIFISDRSNRIILSTNPTRENEYEILANITYLEQIEPGDTFAPIFYVSPFTGKPTVTFATSIRDNTGTRQGIILANLNLERIDQIVRERAGLGDSGETYLVGSLVSQNTFISKEYTNPQTLDEGISSIGIDAAMSGVSGSGLYQNYAGMPVLGVYRWLNDQDLALLVEMSQEEAFAPARQLAGTIMLVGIVSAGLLLSGVYWLSGQLSISRRQLEDYSHRLEHKAQEADAANRAKSEFLANMSHELRTPLNAILGFAQLMERDATLNLQQRESLATINRSGEHLLSLINDVLEMAKIEAGRTVLNPDFFDLYCLLQNLQEMFQLRAAAKGLSLQFTLAPNLPQYVVTDEGKLRQVLINLLSNAIKFTEEGSVRLRAKGEQENGHFSPSSYTLYFEIEDTGKGIASEEADKLFNPFVQTASSVKSEGGTGLGLSISRQFVRLMEGEIDFNSSLGKGSTFYFKVKAILAKPPQIKPWVRQRVLHLALGEPEYRILVVDDRQENRDLLAQLLSPVGFQIRTATNGKEAIALWRRWQPHLIWMDMRMPVMDGYEATRQIKAQPQGQETVIIALTATVFEEQQAKILGAGCDDLVRKPFQEQTIFDKIAQYLKVKYVYEDQSPSLLSTATQRASLSVEGDRLQDLATIAGERVTSQDLKVMPTEWIRALQQAAIQVDADLINQLLTQIPPAYSALAEGLAELVHQYDFDRIVELSGLETGEK